VQIVMPQPTGFIRAVNGAFVDDACNEFWPVGWNSCAPVCMAFSSSLCADKINMRVFMILLCLRTAATHPYIKFVLACTARSTPCAHVTMRAM
jgi:hypothetical protein